MKKAFRILSIVTIAISYILGLSILWWWALIGIGEDILFASVVTTAAIFFPGITVLIWSEE